MRHCRLAGHGHGQLTNSMSSTIVHVSPTMLISSLHLVAVLPAQDFTTSLTILPYIYLDSFALSGPYHTSHEAYLASGQAKLHVSTAHHCTLQV